MSGREIEEICAHTDITDGGKMVANLGELGGGGGDGHLVALLGDTELLNIDVHQLQLELRNLVLL